MLSARRPRRTYIVRQHGVAIPCYRATAQAVRATWRRDRLDVRAMDEAADAALEALWEAIGAAAEASRELERLAKSQWAHHV